MWTSFHDDIYSFINLTDIIILCDYIELLGDACKLIIDKIAVHILAEWWSTE